MTSIGRNTRARPVSPVNWRAGADVRQKGTGSRGLDLIEVACLGGLLLAFGFGAGRHFVLNYHDTFVSPRDLQWLRDKYGSQKWSENAEEWIIRDFFQDARGGTFLDIGSADARVGSNTFFLEDQLGWSGIAIDALDTYAPSYQKLRPHTKFFALFVSDRSDDTATMFVSKRYEQYSSATRNFTSQYTPDAVAKQVHTITLNDLLAPSAITNIDFMSMDIELSEPKALAGLDLHRYMPRLVCIEAHPETRQHILDYFAARGYTVVGKYLRLDQINLWFTPLAPR
jgi:FkbM family methyltransferase